VTIEDILKRKNIEASVVNQYGEGIYLGNPKTAHHNKYNYTFSWDIDPAEHKSPFDTLLFHNNSTILKVIPTTMFRLDGNIRSLTVHIT
jgi:hypothetical protein